MSFPSSTITFLFTDIEGSTRLWEEQPATMRLALARHDALLRSAIETNNGVVFKTVGDAFCAAFAAAPDALAASLAAQSALVSHNREEGLSLRVRMALHTGAVECREGDYFGQPLNRIARLLAIGHGGQVLLSGVVHDLCRDSLPTAVTFKHLGEHRLRDLGRPEIVFQLLHPDLPSEFPSLRSLDNQRLPNNLPQQVTSFVGRDKEMAQVKHLLTATHLLTLTGSGGCGKTRLSLQVAADLLDQYADGVWLVELAPLTDPTLVPQAVASVLNIKEEGGKPLTQTLAERMRGKHLLLVLDNCEHLLAACADLADRFIHACPHITILASSREPLGIAGETIYRIPSMSLPDRIEGSTQESLSQYEAVRLFIERAVTVAPAFTVTNANAPAVAQVCHRLGGIPLAIELAAARIRVLPIEQIASRLDDRFRLLTGGSRTALPRHQTLRALMDWSYSLLTNQERLLLGRLSVFSGGWTLEAAEAVCTEDGIAAWEVLDLLTSLVDKSLVVYEEPEAEARYHLQETIRAYGREKLAETGKFANVSQHHLDFYLSLAEAAFKPLLGAEPGQTAWQKRLERDIDNLRTALEWSLSGEKGEEGALRLTGALWWFWLNSYLREGGEWTRRALAKGRNAPSSVLARALLALGSISFFQGDFGEAGLSAEDTLQVAREEEDRWYRGNALFLKALLMLHKGELAEAQRSADEGASLAQEVGEPWLMRRFLLATGQIAWVCGDYATARAFLSQALETYRTLQDEWHIAITLANLGFVTRGDGDIVGARALHREGLPLSLRMGDRRCTAWHLVGMAGVESEQSRAERAARLLGAAAAELLRLGSPLPPHHQKEQDRVQQQTQTTLDAAGFAAAWAKGQEMMLEQAVEYALEED